MFVEHTGLFIEALNGFPGGLTQLFWDTVGAERVAALFDRVEALDPPVVVEALS